MYVLFDILSSLEIEKLSKLKIENTKQLDNSSIFDNCNTNIFLHKKNNDLGNFGYIKLKTLFFHPLFIDEIYKQFKKICLICFQNKDKCNHKKFFFYKNYDYCFITRNEKEKFSIKWYPSKIYDIFQKTRVKDSYQNFFFIRNILIPPMQVRPYHCINNIKMFDHNITFQIKMIIKLNNFLKKTNLSEIRKKEIEERLQLHLKSFFIKSTNIHQNRKSIKDLIDRKEGIIRGNIMGKRVNFSARTVIGPDPSLNIDEIGIPLSISQNMTTKTNQLMNQIVSEENLLKNRDVVLFNRQPTLHRGSIMGYKIKILPYSTFRMNLFSTTPFNADFDGDEMTIYIPQSSFSKTEIEEIMFSGKNFLSIRTKQPNYGFIQDICVIFFKILHKDFFAEFSKIIFFVAKKKKTCFPTILKPKKYISGKDIFSFNLKQYFFNKDYINRGDKKNQMIRNGILIKGFFNKNDISKFMKYVYKKILINQKIILFLNEINEMCMFIMQHFFNYTITLMDCQNKEILQRNNIQIMINCKSKGTKFNFEQITNCIGQQYIQGKIIGNTLDGKRSLPFFSLKQNVNYSNSKLQNGYIQKSYMKGMNMLEFFFHALVAREGLVDTSVKTSETGYFQRKLIKSFENIQYHCDNTTKNQNYIIQFIYPKIIFQYKELEFVIKNVKYFIEEKFLILKKWQKIFFKKKCFLTKQKNNNNNVIINFLFIFSTFYFSIIKMLKPKKLLLLYEQILSKKK